MDFIRKYLRFEPFFINTQIFYYSGFGYIRSRKKWINILYSIYRFFCFFSITVTFFIQMVDVYLLLDDLGKLAQDGCSIIVTFMVFVKMHIISFRTHQVEELQEKFTNFQRSRTHPEEEEIFAKASWIVLTMTKVFYLLGTTCVLFWIFFPAFETASGRHLPYPWLFPVDPYQSPYYEVIYVYQSLSLFSYLINIVSVDVGYCSCMVLIISQYKILGRDIRKISSAYDENKEESRSIEMTEDSIKALGDAIKLHNGIVDQIKTMQDIFGDILFVQMSLVALMIATVILDTVVNSQGFTLRLVQRVLYVLSACFDTWLLCFWGTQIREQSYYFAQEIYSASWIDMDVKVRKILLLMMMKAQKAPKLKNGMLSLELPLFLEIMQYAYNAVALLKNTT